MLMPVSRTTRLLLLILLTLAAAPAFAGINRWTPFGPGGGSIDDVVLDPRSPETLWIASAGTVYKSEDGGTSWHPSASGLELLFDRVPPRTVYAATYADGILRSRDGGATWEPLNNGLPLPIRGPVTVLVQDPVRGQRFYTAPGSGGFYRADFTAGPL